jgi:Domain of unknown function (DUF4349)
MVGPCRAGALAAVLMASGVARAVAVGAERAPVPLRLPIRNGMIAVKVVDYDAARQRVLDAALQQGAELLKSRTEVNFQGKKHGWMWFLVAADRLPRLLPEVLGVGKLYAENLATTEHTPEYEGLARRVDQLHEHQQRLQALLESRRRLRGSDILYIQERLFRAGVDEGTLRQRRVDLERAAQVNTLAVELFEPEPRRVMDLGNYYAGAALRARVAFHRLLARALTLGAYVLIFAPVWIPALFAAFLTRRWLRRRLAGIAARFAG